MPLLHLIVLVLAVAGGIALSLRLAQSLFRLALTAANATAAAKFAEVSARRGDLTGLTEHRAAERRARRAGAAEIAWALGCALVLFVSLPLGVAREAYAAAAVLWFFPRGPLHHSAAPPTA